MMIRITIDGKKRDLTPEHVEEIVSGAVKIILANRKVTDTPTDFLTDRLKDEMAELDFVTGAAGLVPVV
jgi:hypothetical protein